MFKGQATISFALDSFDAADCATKLKEAMDGFGTNEEAIIEVLAKHSCDERLKIAEAYKQSYGADLVEDLKGELGGNFEDIVVAMVTPPRVYDARQLHDAIAGAGTCETTLVEILLTRTPEEIEEIKEKYQEEFEETLEEALLGDNSGYFGNLLVCLCNNKRESGEESDVDYGLAASEAQELYDSGVGKCGTDEREINKILMLRSFPQLRATFRAYEGLCGRESIEDDLSSETSGDLAEGFLSIVRVANDMSKYFADRLKCCMAGLGTQDDPLIRIIVSRSEVDLHDIKQKFAELNGQSLEEAVDSETGGDYKRMLIALIRGNIEY